MVLRLGRTRTSLKSSLISVSILGIGKNVKKSYYRMGWSIWDDLWDGLGALVRKLIIILLLLFNF